MVPTVYIDGESGTTGLQIRQRLAGRTDLRLITIDPALRKNARARRECLNGADLVVLCLPDEAAREAVALIESPATRVIDASTAHRTAPGWIYGFPELTSGQREALRVASRVANPGCWSTGFIALVRPLVDNGLVPSNWALTVHGVSGYSGGGKAMIAEFEDAEAPNYATTPFRIYALSMGHKHIPEMERFSGLVQSPLFSPAVGRYLKGMIVEVPLPLRLLPRTPTLAHVHAALSDAYEGERFVEVVPLQDSLAMSTVEPEALNGSNRMRLHVFGSDSHGQARLVAVLDNLGKGASGAAVQNLNLMLALGEGTGL